MKATIENLKGKKERVFLPAAAWQGNETINPGVHLLGLYIGPKTGRMFAEFYSYWQKQRSQERIGIYCEEVDLDKYLSLCEVAGIDPKIEAIEV